MRIFDQIKDDQSKVNGFYEGLEIIFNFYKLLAKGSHVDQQNRQIGKILKIIVKWTEADSYSEQEQETRIKFLQDHFCDPKRTIHRIMNELWLRNKNVIEFFKPFLQNAEDQSTHFFRNKFTLEIIKYLDSSDFKKRLLEKTQKNLKFNEFEEFNQERRKRLDRVAKTIFSPGAKPKDKDKQKGPRQRNLGYVRHALVVAFNPSLADYLILYFSQIKRAKGKNLLKIKFVNSLLHLLRIILKRRISFIEWTFFVKESNFIQKLRILTLLFLKLKMFKIPLEEESEEVRKQEVEKSFQKLKRSYQKVGRDLADIDFYLNNSEIETLVREVKNDVSKNLERELLQKSVVDLAGRLSKLTSEITKFKNVIFLGSTIFKKIFVIDALLNKQKSLVFYYFSREQVEEVTEFTRKFKTNLYNQTLKFYNFQKSPKQPTTPEELNRLRKSLGNANNKLIDLVRTNSNQGIRDFNKLDYYFHGADLGQEKKALERLFEAAGAGYAEQFADMHERYILFKRIKDMIDYLDFFYELVYASVGQKPFRKLQFYSDFKRVLKKQTELENPNQKKILKIIQQIDETSIKFVYIRELSTRYKGTRNSRALHLLAEALPEQNDASRGQEAAEHAPGNRLRRRRDPGQELRPLLQSDQLLLRTALGLRVNRGLLGSDAEPRRGQARPKVPRQLGASGVHLRKVFGFQKSAQ